MLFECYYLYIYIYVKDSNIILKNHKELKVLTAALPIYLPLLPVIVLMPICLGFRCVGVPLNHEGAP